MTMLVVGLYDQANEANKAIDTLRSTGVKRSDIERIKTKEEDKGFFKNLFNSGGGNALNADELAEMGISDDDAKFYANAVRDGRTLLIVRCAPEETSQVRQILSQFQLSDYGQAPSQVEAGGIVEEQGVGNMPGESFRGEHEVYGGPEYAVGAEEERVEAFGSDEERVEEGRISASAMEYGPGQGFEEVDERTETVTDSPRSNEVVIEDLYGLAQRDFGRFDQFEGDLRGHYDMTYAADGERFEDYNMGYRYGMALAEHEPYRGLSWIEVQPEAEQGWEAHNKGTWNRFRDAVEFGWSRIRGDEAYRRPSTRI